MRSRILAAFAAASVVTVSCRPGLPESPRTPLASAARADCPGGVLTVGPSGGHARITDALAQARGLRLRAGELERARGVICIDVAPGRYLGTFDPETLAARPGYEAFPLVIDVPGVAVRGATALVLDEHGRPASVGASATTLVADPPAADETQAYFLVTTTERSEGESRVRSSGHAARIEGFELSFSACNSTGSVCGATRDCLGGESCELRRRGTGIWAHLVQDYTIRGNAISGAGGFAVQHSFASGRTIRNLLTHNSPTGISWRGPAQGSSLVRQNTSTHNAVGGMVAVCAVGNFALPALVHERDLAVVVGSVDGTFELVDLEIDGNDFSHHALDPGFSFGLRVMMFGAAPFPPGRTRCSAAVTNNRMLDTSFGIVTDAGFPNRTRDGVAVDTVWNAGFQGRYARNEVQGLTQNVLVSLTRFTSTRDCRELDPARPTSFQFLRGSSYAIESDAELGSLCYDNRVLDPLSGAPLGNELRIDGALRRGLTCAQDTACD